MSKLKNPIARALEDYCRDKYPLYSVNFAKNRRIIKGMADKFSKFTQVCPVSIEAFLEGFDVFVSKGEAPTLQTKADWAPERVSYYMFVKYAQKLYKDSMQNKDMAKMELEKARKMPYIAYKKSQNKAFMAILKASLSDNEYNEYMGLANKYRGNDEKDNT